MDLLTVERISIPSLLALLEHLRNVWVNISMLISRRDSNTLSAVLLNCNKLRVGDCRKLEKVCVIDRITLATSTVSSKVPMFMSSALASDTVFTSIPVDVLNVSRASRTAGFKT